MPAVTVGDIARDVLASLDSRAGYLIAARWVTRRYADLVSQSRFRHLRRIGAINFPAVLTTGLVQANPGDRRVYGNDDALAAWATRDIEGFFIRLHTAWYRVASQLRDHLVLAVPFSETHVGTAPLGFGDEGFGNSEPIVTDAEGGFGNPPFGSAYPDGGGYAIVPRLFKLPPEVRWLGEFVHMRRRIALQKKTMMELDVMAPERQIVFYGPTIVADFGRAPDQSMLVELYPYSSLDETIGYTYWASPPELGVNDPVPVVIDPHILREGALIDAMRWEMAQSLRAGKDTIAATWRNEYRAQETRWKQYIEDAIRTDRGEDDVTMVLRTFANNNYPPLDITDARGYVWANGNRP